MEDSVLVIVGEWLWGDFRRWHFRVSRNDMAKFVGLSDESTYESSVVEAFDVNKKMAKTCLSFLYEEETSRFTRRKMPPVSITSDVGIRQFRNYRNEKKGLNMLLTLKTVDDGVAANEVHGSLDIQEKDKPVDDDHLVAHLESVEAAYRAKTGGQKGKERSGTFVFVPSITFMVINLKDCTLWDRKMSHLCLLFIMPLSKSSFFLFYSDSFVSLMAFLLV